MCIYDDGNSVFRAKTTICNAKLGDLGIMGTGGQYSTMWSKVQYVESPTLICLFIMQLLWGYTLMIKGSLLLSAPIVKHFRKNLSLVLGQNLTVLGVK